MVGLGATLGLVGLGLYFERQRRWRAAETERANRPPERPAGVPVGPFNEKSTAEEVTHGIDLTDKTILVTGATSGLGLETMRVLALRGAHVIGTGRSLERARAACQSVPGKTTPLALDLTDFPGVVACAAAVRALGVSLDGLICNAGIMALQKLAQVQGIEEQFATNHLGHFLLTTRLLDLIESAPQGRIVVVSSGVMIWSDPAGIEWDNLSGERNYDPNRAYGQSKLANALFSLELARRLEGTRATANSLHPGYIETQLFRHYPVSLRGFRGLLSRRPQKTIAQGAATSCYLATAPVLAAVSGRYFTGCNPLVPDARAEDRVAAARLWEVSTRLLGAYLA